MKCKAFLVELTLAVVFLTALAGARVLAAEAAKQDAPAATPEQRQPADNPGQQNSGAGFDFFSDKPVESKEVVELPPEKSPWITIGGPLALLVFFFALDLAIWWLVPFSDHSIELNLRELPPAVKRGIAMAVVMFGIAFCFGASEIAYQLKLHGSAEAYFAQMSLGKLIAFTHAHLFGFTTSFFIVGIPFSLQFNHIRLYQWVFPVGLP